MKNPFMRFSVQTFGSLLMKPLPFTENYFLDDAKIFRKAVSIPLIYVGGVNSLETIDTVLNQGFKFVSMARALINDPAFINKLKQGELTRSACNHANYCIAVMYSGKMACHQHQADLPAKWKSELEKVAY